MALVNIQGYGSPPVFAHSKAGTLWTRAANILQNPIAPNSEFNVCFVFFHCFVFKVLIFITCLKLPLSNILLEPNSMGLNRVAANVLGATVYSLVFKCLNFVSISFKTSLFSLISFSFEFDVFWVHFEGLQMNKRSFSHDKKCSLLKKSDAIVNLPVWVATAPPGLFET